MGCRMGFTKEQRLVDDSPAPVPDPDAAAVLAAVTDIVREVCEDPNIKLTPETETDAIPAWQELTRAGIAVEAECRFDVCFQAPEIVALRTVGDLIALIATKRAHLHA
jgi:acyl carrier protein